MNPLFEKLLQAQARAERGNAFQQEFEYRVTTIQGVTREPHADDAASTIWATPELCPAR